MFYMNLTNCELGLPHYQTGAHLSLMYDYLFSGPVIGSGLYSLGGFLLPFVTVGSVGIILGKLSSGSWEEATNILLKPIN